MKKDYQRRKTLIERLQNIHPKTREWYESLTTKELEEMHTNIISNAAMLVEKEPLKEDHNRCKK